MINKKDLLIKAAPVAAVAASVAVAAALAAVFGTVTPLDAQGPGAACSST
jgi:hypothetical protein